MSSCNRLMIRIAMLVLTMLVSVMPCAALKEGGQYTYTPQGESVPAPSSYIAERVLYGKDLGFDALWNPEDVFVDDEGNIYIADTGNDRILIADSSFKPLGVIDKVIVNGQEETLSRPRGIYKQPDGPLFICDTENHRVIGIDKNKHAVRLMDGDDLIVVNENIDFRPEKVVVTNDDIAYVVASDIYQGIVCFNARDKFSSFFAPNEVKVTVNVAILNMWKNLFSKKQQESMEKTLPSPYNNIFLSPDSFFYTTAGNVRAGDEIKCMNSMGINILRTPRNRDKGTAYGDLEVSYENNEYVTSRFIDVHADEKEIFAGLDVTRNRVFQYDRECSLISVFGGTGTQDGQFEKVAAIEKLGDRYLVLDSQRGSLTVFSPTAYANEVLQALEYYNRGLYVESVEKWENILKKNSNFAIAYRSIGRACLQEGKSKQAMEMLKKGEDKYFYSLALKEYRKEFTRRYLPFLLIGAVIVLVVLIRLIKSIRKRLIGEEA